MKTASEEGSTCAILIGAHEAARSLWPFSYFTQASGLFTSQASGSFDESCASRSNSHSVEAFSLLVFTQACPCVYATNLLRTPAYFEADLSLDSFLTPS